MIGRIASRRLAHAWVVLFALLLATSAAAKVDPEARVRADLERFLRAGAASAGAEIELPPLARFAVPTEGLTGDLRTELSTRARPPFSGRLSVTVELFADGRLLQRGIVTPYVRVTESVVVPSRDLRRGDVVSAEDLRVVKRDRERLPIDPLRRKSDAVGQRVKRSVRKDAVMRSSQLESVPVVERGDRVAIVLESGALTIRGMGQAKEAGAVGDWIRVVNLDSRREISGRVDREGRVHVAF